MTNNLLLSLTIIKKTKVIRKTNNKIRKFYVKQYIKDALRIKNGPDVIETF
jgi:hypothetical protein